MAWLGGATEIPWLDQLIQAGPKTNTQPVFGGDVGLSPAVKALWDFAMRQRLDPMSSIGFSPLTVSGPGAQQFLSAVPQKLGNFLQKMPEDLYVHAPKYDPVYAGAFDQWSPKAKMLGAIQWEGPKAPETAVHEALHALTWRKGQQALKENPTTTQMENAAMVKNADKIAAALSIRYPQLIDFAHKYLLENYAMKQIADEIATEGMTQNIMRRAPK